MPELPEVETTCQGIKPHITGKVIEKIIVRQAQLRWPIPEDLDQQCRGLTITKVKRRAKYILLETNSANTLIIHLGMSGFLRILHEQKTPEKHDHVDLMFTDGTLLRYNDTRRFGAVLLTSAPIESHKLISSLGPEPFSKEFSGQHLYHLSRDKKSTIKSFIMDGHHVVGVGNIYASEALFLAGIHPNRAAGKIALKRYQKLAECIKIILQQAIDQGGTTLRDFVNEQGNSGYFQQSLSVYGRNDQACKQCSTVIKQIKIAQRASYYCPQCQH